MSETTVGSIIAYLRMDDSDWRRTIDQAKAKAEDLGKTDPKIKISVDSASALSKLTAVSAALNTMRTAQEKVAVAQAKLSELEKAGDAPAAKMTAARNALTSALRNEENAAGKLAVAYKRVQDATDSAGKTAATSLPQIQPMMAAIVAGAVLVAPALGAATAAAVGFGAAAGVAFAAYKGFEEEIKNGTALGMSVKSQLDGISGAFRQLETAAAHGAAPGVLNALSQVKNYLPTLTPLVADLSAHLGNALNIGTGGLIQGLRNMAPLMADAGHYAEGLATKFAEFTSSTGFKDFIGYAQLELPIVFKMLGDVTGGVVQLAMSFKQQGQDIITVLDGIGKAMSALSRVKNFLDNFDMMKHYGAVGKLPETYNASADAVSNFITQLSQAPPISQQVADGMKKQADQTQLATAMMQAQNDAAGLLKQSLDLLSGNKLSDAQAENSFEQGLVRMVKATTKADSAVTGLSSSAIKNRGDLLTLVSSAQTAAEAYGKMSGSTEDGRTKLIALRQQIIDNAAATGMNRDEVTKYIDSVLQIPPKASTTGDLRLTDAEQKLAAYKTALAQLPQTVNTSLHVANADTVINSLSDIRNLMDYVSRGVQVDIGVSGRGIGGQGGIPKGQADGGYITGPGTGTSDQAGLFALSNGEFVNTAKSTQKNRAALEAGNRGAKLTVAGYADGGLVSITPPVKSGAGHGSGHSGSGHAAGGHHAAKQVPVVVMQLSVTAGAGAAYGIADVIKGQTGQARLAMKDLSIAVNDAFQLKGVRDQLAYAQSQLANFKQAQASMASTVAGNLSSGVDASKYADVGGLLSAYQNNTASNNRFATEEDALSRRGLNRGLLSELIGKGDSAGLATLFNASQSELAQVNKAYAGYQGSAQYAGSVAANGIYGSQVAAWQQTVTQLTARGNQLENAVDALVGAVGAMTNRPVQVTLDGKVIAHAVIGGKEFQGVFDSLRNKLLYGRKR